MLSEMPVDFQLAGSLIATATAVPYVAEVLGQLRLLARFMSFLPIDARARLPLHPRHPWLAVFSSARFFLALFRYALRNDLHDPSALVALKRKMRASILREAVFGIGFAVALVLLWRGGWRPQWPHVGD